MKEGRNIVERQKRNKNNITTQSLFPRNVVIWIPLCCLRIFIIYRLKEKKKVGDDTMAQYEEAYVKYSSAFPFSTCHPKKNEDSPLN